MAELVMPMTRQVYFRDGAAPTAQLIWPSVFVAARNAAGELLLVRRCDSGEWELPGGRMDVGEDAVTTAVRETAEETGLHVEITGLAGLFSDPAHIIRSRSGAVRQQFAVVLHAVAEGGRPRADHVETREAAWVALDAVATLQIEAGMRTWIGHALPGRAAPHLG